MARRTSAKARRGVAEATDGAPDKAGGAFRTIREVADWLGVPTHVLRFWESKFPEIAPVKGAGGRRYYRPEVVALIGGIKRMLHDEGATIRAVQTRIAEEGREAVAALAGPLPGEGADAVASPRGAAPAKPPAPPGGATPSPEIRPDPEALAPAQPEEVAIDGPEAPPPQPEPADDPGAAPPAEFDHATPPAPAEEAVPAPAPLDALRALLDARGARPLPRSARRPMRRLLRRMDGLAAEIAEDMDEAA